MSQLGYKLKMKAGAAGLIYDTAYNDFVSKLAAGEVPFGRLVVKGPSKEQVVLPDATGEVTDLFDGNKGIAVRSASIEGVKGAPWSSYKDADTVNVLKRGRIWVVVEGAFTANTQAFVRFQARPAVAQVNTLTPDVSDQEVQDYVVTVNGVVYTFTSDATPSAAEVVTGLTALINGDVNSKVTASGSTTLILTAKTAGVPFTVDESANLTDVATTANVVGEARLGAFRSDTDSGRAVALPNARFVEFDGNGDGPDGDYAVLEFDFLG